LVNRNSRSSEQQKALNHYKSAAMKEKGYSIDPSKPDLVKYEVADELGISLEKGYNGNMTSENAGKIGGQIGGSMVKKMIADAQRNLKNQ
jgi:small acid-soluble spore protein D (minor alpha/beta-type SASP)